jgi:hypothetical protein
MPDHFEAPFHPAEAGQQPLPRHGLTLPVLVTVSTFFATWHHVKPYTQAFVEESLKAKASGHAAVLEIEGSLHLSQSDFALLFEQSVLLFSECWEYGLISRR